MVKRYELTDAQWQRVEGLLPGKKRDPGRTAADNRLFVNGVLWVLRSGAHWHDLPARYGKWKSVHTRFARWAKNGTWERMFEVLIKDREWTQHLRQRQTRKRAQNPGRACTRHVSFSISRHHERNGARAISLGCIKNVYS